MNYYDIDDHVEAVMRWLEDHAWSSIPRISL